MATKGGCSFTRNTSKFSNHQIQLLLIIHIFIGTGAYESCTKCNIHPWYIILLQKKTYMPTMLAKAIDMLSHLTAERSILKGSGVGCQYGKEQLG